MNSGTIFSDDNQRKDTSQFNKANPAVFTLSNQQFQYIQHYLPKGFALMQGKSNKREKKETTGKFESENISRLSGNFDDDHQPRKKNNKKKYNHIQDGILKAPKRTSTQKLDSEDEMLQCFDILSSLKKHQKAYPFLEPVDPQMSGALDYFEVIKEPMDLSAIERNLNSGIYQTPQQFKSDINKIWTNSYSYNDKTSPIFKMAHEMDKYCRKLENSMARKHARQKERVRTSKSKTELRYESEHSESKFNNDSLAERVKSLPTKALKEIFEAIGKPQRENSSFSNINFNSLDSGQIARLEEIVNNNQYEANQKEPQQDGEQQSQKQKYYDSNSFA